MTNAEIIALKGDLMRANVPLCEWGKGECKTMTDLAKEIDAGESILEFRNGKLYRLTRVVLLDMFYHDQATGDMFHLIQKEQLPGWGKIKERTYISSVSEKLKRGENPDEKAINRALLEELEIEDETHFVIPKQPFMTLKNSNSYKGIATISQLFPYSILLNDKQYKPGGYTETRDGITTIFLWSKVEKKNKDEYVTVKVGQRFEL